MSLLEAFASNDVLAHFEIKFSGAPQSQGKEVVENDRLASQSGFVRRSHSVLISLQISSSLRSVT
jgi:hypothetical protein